AKLADRDHQRRIEQAAQTQVVEQRRQRLVETRRGPAEAVPARAEDRRAAAVHVPRFDAEELVARRQPAPADHTDQAPAGLDQPAGQQQVLAERVPAVGVAHTVRLARQIKGPPRGGTSDDVQGALAIHIESTPRGNGTGVKLSEKAEAIANALAR